MNLLEEEWVLNSIIRVPHSHKWSIQGVRVSVKVSLWELVIISSTEHVCASREYGGLALDI